MIETLTLTDFRNHTTSRIVTHGRRNIIITGPNGAGKTAVLEALSMLSGDRGCRGASMTDIARFGASGGFAVAATLHDDTDISVFFDPADTNRRARIDGAAVPLSALGAKLRIVWITPREDRIFVDDASARRAFFDRLASSFDAAHAGRVARLGKLMSERAAILRGANDARWLDAIDAQIAATATAVAATRIQYAGEINYFLSDFAVSVTGRVEGAIIDQNAAAAEREYMEYLRGNRTLVGDKMNIDGPHRSDFGLFNRELNLPVALTSTGQQKTALIELIVAHARLIHTKTGATPIILLDEAAAHLDNAARMRMFAALHAADAQVWATGLDEKIFADVTDAAFVACQCGVINNIVLSGIGKHEQN